ncbi:MAG: PD-(D/E)XK nuclease family protein [Verrucomicrobiota bacterium]
MSCRIVQYRVVEGAWKEVVEPWLRQNSLTALTGSPVWIVGSHGSQSSWMKRKALQAGISSLGVEWLTGAALRRALCQFHEVPFKPFGRENLEFLIQLHTERDLSGLESAVGADASECLLALDELGRSGWMPEDYRKLDLPKSFEKWGDLLESTNAWVPGLEAQCLERLYSYSEENRGGQALVFGWGAEHFSELRVLEILERTVEELLIVVPQPRFIEHADVDSLWIESLEQKFEVVSEICSDPKDWQCQHQPFVDALVQESAPEIISVPELKVGATSETQVALVLDWLSKKKLDEADELIGVLVSGEGGSLTRTSSAFIERGICFHQEIGETASSGPFFLFHKFLVRYFLSQCDVEEVLRFIEWLLISAPSICEDVGFLKLRDCCRRRFSQMQTRSFPTLFSDKFNGDSTEYLFLHRLATGPLASWNSQISWEEAKHSWKEISSFFRFGTDYLEPVWSRLDQQLSGQQLKARAFYEYIQSLLESPGLWRSDKAISPFAKIVLTTPEQATGRTWGHLVWMDCQEGAWPRGILENPLLTDDYRRELNQRPDTYSRLLTRQDRDQLKRRVFPDLLENCRGDVLMTGALVSGSAPEQKTFPNEWAAQVLLSTHEDARAALDGWSAAEQLKLSENRAQEDRSTVLSSFVKDDFVKIHDQRCDPSSEPGEWEFDLGDVFAGSELALSASELDQWMHYPASQAMAKIFHASPRRRDDFNRQEALILGILTHQRLSSFFEKHPSCLIESLPEYEFENELSPKEGIWWQVLDRKSHWMVESCLSELKRFGEGYRIGKTEWMPPPARLGEASSRIQIRGRIDLTLTGEMQDEKGDLLVIDFKTGKGGEIPTLAKLNKDAVGLQFVSYLKLCRNESETCRVRVINPFGAPDRILDGSMMEEAALHFRTLEAMCARGVFLRTGNLYSEHDQNHETLPLTTLPVSIEVLAKKWTLAFRSEDESND